MGHKTAALIIKCLAKERPKTLLTKHAGSDILAYENEICFLKARMALLSQYSPGVSYVRQNSK